MVLFAAGLWIRDRMKRIEQWPRTIATVHHVETYYTLGWRGGKHVEFRLQFSFPVAGRTYEHTKIIRPTRYTGSYWWFVTEGSQLDVAYDPADPTTAVLEKEPKSLLKNVWTFAFLFLSAWAIHGVLFIRARLKKDGEWISSTKPGVTGQDPPIRLLRRRSLPGGLSRTRCL